MSTRNQAMAGASILLAALVVGAIIVAIGIIAYAR